MADKKKRNFLTRKCKSFFLPTLLYTKLLISDEGDDTEMKFVYFNFSLVNDLTSGQPNYINLF